MRARVLWLAIGGWLACARSSPVTSTSSTAQAGAADGGAPAAAVRALGDEAGAARELGDEAGPIREHADESGPIHEHANDSGPIHEHANDSAVVPPSDAPRDLPRRAAAPPPEGMLLVPGGTFTMGADRGGQEDEHPAHAVTLRPFFLDRTEVTNAAYAACERAGACKHHASNIASLTRSGDDAQFNLPNRPVVGVSWYDARDYCAWAGKRLPREAELERAVRDDDGRRFPWGNDPPTPARTVFGRPLGSGHTDDVGAHPTGRGPYGHEDLAGNVWEWMADDYDPYAYRRPGAAEGRPGTCNEILAAQNELRAQGKQGFTGSNPIPTECEKSIRGGAFNYDADGLRSTNRVHHPARYRLVMTGLRCAKDAD